VEKVVELSRTAAAEAGPDESVNLRLGSDDVEVLLSLIGHEDRRTEPAPPAQIPRTSSLNSIADLSIFPTPPDDGIVVV
jgi:hypothetical protein